MTSDRGLEEENRRLRGALEERERAAAELARTRALLASLIESVEGIVYDCDAATLTFSFVSQQAERLLGYPLRRWLEEPDFWARHLHPDDRDRVVAACRAHTARGESHTFECRMVAADGRVVWLRDVVTFVQEPGRPARLRGLMVDVTEQRAAEAARRASEERFRQLAESIEEVFWLTDLAKGEVLYVSPSYARIWGRPCEELYLRPRGWLDAIHPADRARVEAALPAQLSGDYREEYRIVLPDGSTRWIADRAFPVRDERGAVFRLAGVAQDITERKRAERLQRRAAAVMESISAGRPLAQVLVEVARALEDVLDEARASVLMLDPDGRRLRHGAAPSLSDDYVRAVDGLEVGPQAGSCGTAAFRRAPVVVADTATDPLWADHVDLARDHGLPACWSTPVLGGEGQVLATLAVYPGQARGPRPDEQECVDQAAHLLRLVLERERRDQALRASEEAFRRAFLDAATGIAITDLAGRFLEANPAYCRMLGYAEDELRALDFLSITHPEDHATNFSLSAELAAGRRESFVLEKRYLAKDGRVVWSRVSVSLQRDVEGRARRCVAVAEDTTAHRAALEELRSSERRFREMAENIGDVFYSYDPRAGRLLYANQAYERLLGRPLARAYADPRGHLEDVHPEDRPAAEAAFARQLAGEATDVELRLVQPGGDVRWVHEHGVPLLDDQGQVERIVGTVRDVTERRRLEQQFLRAQRMESIGTLAGGIAHDLNNVLAPILIAADLLARDEPDPGRRDLIAGITRGAQRGAALIQQILSFARGAPGERVLLDLAAVAREVHRLAADTFPKGVRLRLEVPRAPWPIRGDRTQLHQVLMNLCVNARDALGGGGELLVRVENARLDASPPGALTAIAPGDYVVAEVHDTGAGIPRELQDRVFDLYFTTKPPGKGSGLGLSTALAIVKSHGGAVVLRSEPGRGTSFRVFLPADVGGVPGEQAPAPPAAGAPRGRGELVLVVDDEEEVRRLVGSTLERFGYRVLLAAHGAEALERFAERRGEVGLVLTDLAMPVLDGFALVRALEALAPGVRVVLSSGHELDAAGGGLEGPGSHLFLAKPYTVEALLQVVREALADR